MKEFQPVAEVEEFQPVAEVEEFQPVAEEPRTFRISAYQKKPSFWDRKITPLLQEVGLSPTTEEIQAQAQNVYSEASDEAEKNVNRILVDESRKLSQEYNIPMRDVFKELSKKRDEVKTDLTVEMMPQIEKNWDDFVYQKYGKLTPRKANERMLGVLSSAGLAVTAAELSPLIPIALKSQAARETIGKVVTGIGTYMVGNEVGLKRILYPAIDFIEKKIQNRPWYYKRIENVRELLPEEHTQAAEDIVNLTEIIGLGAISAKFAQKSPEILRKLTKDTFTSYKLPSKLYVTPQDLRNMPEGELRQFMGDIGITGDKEGQAQRVASFLKQGGEVSFPPEKIVTLVDKPYWAKIKGVFRISPFKQVSVSKIPLTTKITPTVFLPEKVDGVVTPPVVTPPVVTPPVVTPPVVTPPVVTPDELRSIVEQSGGVWKGIGKGLPAEGKFPATPDLVYFDDPVTKSTMTMPINKVTPEEVKTHLAESRKKFKIKPTTENQEIINQIEIIKDNVSKDLGENAAFLLKSLSIYNTDEVAGVLSWDKMKRFNQSTEKNIQEIYNYFARKQNSPLVSDIRFGNDPYNPLKDMSGGIEGGGQLDSKIVNKTLRAYQSINKNIQTQLSTTKDIKETAKAVDMDGNELVDMDGTPMEVNSDGTITLYHRTNLEGATKINKTGNFVSKENTNETFFSNKIEGQAEGYGDEIIAVKVKPSDVRINDAFHGGEIHVAISNKKLSKSSLFKLSPTVAKGGEIKIGANIVYKTESGKEQSGIIDHIFQGTIYALADGATTSFPITEKQIVKVIPQKYVGEKPKIKRNVEDFTEDEYVKRIGAATGLSKEEVRLAYRQYMAEYNKSPQPTPAKGGEISFDYDITGKKNNFKIDNTGKEGLGIKAIEKNRKIIQEKLIGIIELEKTDKIKFEAKMREAIDLAKKSNDILKLFEKEYGAYRQPYDIDAMKRKITGGMRENQLEYSKTLPVLEDSSDTIKVYRGIKDKSSGNIVAGDFVSIDKEYAKEFGENIIEAVISKRDLRLVSSTKEMIYNPSKLSSTPAKGGEIKIGLIEGKANFPKSPSGNAMAGFWGGKKIPVEMGEFVYKLKPMEFPEIVELAKDLMGKYPELKTFIRIKLHPDLFKRGNEQELAITLAHQLGHLVDYLPDYTLKRGNILGRLLSLHKFMKHTFNLMINKEFKTELLRVTQYLHPFDENTVSKKYVSYRKSSRELYAEAISLLVNSPGTMEKLAPNFTKAFFDNLDKKLDVKEAYFGLQRLLNGERADLLEHRWENIQDMFTKGEVRRLEIEAEAKARRTSSWSIVRQFLDVKTAPLEQRMRQVEKSGKLISPEKNPLYKLEQEDLAQSYIQNQFIQNIDIPILQELIKNGITLNQFGSYLFLKRVAGKLDIVSDEIQDSIDDEDVDVIQECLLEYTDRKDLASPLGLNSESANELLEFMRNKLGDKFKIIEEMGQLFKKFLLSQEERAAINGRYNLNTFEKIVRPNNDYYVAFGVNDYLQRGVTASIVKQKGTLKGIENPLVTTLLKLVSLMRDNIRQEAKVSALNFFKENMPEEFKTKRQVGYEGEFNIYENGKLVTYYVDKYLAKTFEFSSEGDLALAMVINKWLGNQFFKDLFVTYNAQFSLWFNPIKDFKETYVALKPFLLQKGHNLTVQELLIAWFKSIPSSHLRQKGIYDNVMQDMMNNFATNTPMVEFDLNVKDETHKFIMGKFNINTMTMEGHKKLLRFLLTPVIKLMEGIKFAGSIFEVNSKVTSWKLLKKYGFGDIEAAHITKRYPGTPDYREKGLLGNTTNAVVFYYNVRKAGIKRAIELGTNPKTRAGYWWAVFEMDIIPTILRIMAELGILGVVLKKFYDKQSEYTKTNYEIFPLGFSVNGKPIGIPIPHSFAGGLVSAILRKMVMSLKGKAKQLEQIFALPYQELPGLAPVIDMAIKNSQYMSGQNPRDDFYGQNILTDREQKARGLIGLKRMIKWNISKTGLIRINNYNTEDSTVMESIMRVNPLTNRILKVADKTDIDVEAEKIKDEMINREQKELRVLIPIKEDFIKSGLTPIEYTKTPAFQKVKNNLRNIYGDDWTPEREMSLTTRIQNIFNDPRTQELWAMQNYRNSQTIEQKKYWLGRAMQAKKDVIKKKLGSFPKSVR